MKVALVHDYIKEYGGAERVLEALHEAFPEAPVFTSVYLPEYLGPHRARFKDWDIRPSILQKIPYKEKLISPLRLLAPFAFGRFDLSSYDVVIVSATGAYFPNSIKTKNHESGIKNYENENHSPLAISHKTIQICYCHTPPRYLYGYATAREWKKNAFLNVVGEVINHVLRMVDADSSKRVDYYIANSEEVAQRIKKFYRREASVIYPPVDVSNSKLKTQNSKLKGKYYLTGGRLARPKHVDLLVRTCTQMGVQLKVFGKAFAGYGEELQMISGPTVEFLGEVSDEEKWKLLSEAKAFLFASEDEDFGIMPVEAMGAGVAVIAYKSGGVKETVIDGRTGIFFESLTVDAIRGAIEKFENLPAGRQGSKIDPKECIKQAEKFAKGRFMLEIEKFVKAKVQASV